jgi:hypothetical protein
MYLIIYCFILLASCIYLKNHTFKPEIGFFLIIAPYEIYLQKSSIQNQYYKFVIEKCLNGFELEMAKTSFFKLSPVGFGFYCFLGFIGCF